MSVLRWLAGRDLPPARYDRVRRAFLAGMGLVHLAAFGSLLAQVEGLIGPQGILPAEKLLERAREVYGEDAGWRKPTLFWWTGAGETALVGTCWAGIAWALVLVLGFVPKLACALLWCLYLSITSVGDVFLGYQWDALLLETTLLAALWAPLASSTK